MHGTSGERSGLSRAEHNSGGTTTDIVDRMVALDSQSAWNRGHRLTS
jgi:hypothetical protein